MQITRRHALSLSAALAATVLTGGAAIFGLTHAPAHAANQATVVQQLPAPQPAQQWTEDD